MAAISLATRLYNAVEYIKTILKLMCPFDKGNLSMNGINSIQVTSNHYQIIIGSEVVPYAVWTNILWNPENHGGHVNPNQGWVEGAIRLATPMIMQIMSGEISQEDVDAIIGANKAAFEQQVAYMVQETQQQETKLGYTPQ